MNVKMFDPVVSHVADMIVEICCQAKRIKLCIARSVHLYLHCYCCLWFVLHPPICQSSITVLDHSKLDGTVASVSQTTCRYPHSIPKLISSILNKDVAISSLHVLWIKWYNQKDAINQFKKKRKLHINTNILGMWLRAGRQAHNLDDFHRAHLVDQNLSLSPNRSAASLNSSPSTIWTGPILLSWC